MAIASGAGMTLRKNSRSSSEMTSDIPWETKGKSEKFSAYGTAVEGNLELVGSEFDHVEFDSDPMSRCQRRYKFVQRFAKVHPVNPIHIHRSRQSLAKRQ